MSYSNGLAALRREAASIAEWDDKGNPAVRRTSKAGIVVKIASAYAD